MTYKKQYAWLTEHGFVDTDICSGNSILWRKTIECLHIDLYWSQYPCKHWSLSIRQIDDVEYGATIANLPDDFDFAQLGGFMDALPSVTKLNLPFTDPK